MNQAGRKGGNGPHRAQIESLTQEPKQIQKTYQHDLQQHERPRKLASHETRRLLCARLPQGLSQERQQLSPADARLLFGGRDEIGVAPVCDGDIVRRRGSR